MIPRKADYYFQTVKPVGNNIDLMLWKKFMKDRLSVSVFANDILNSQQMSFGSLAAQPNVLLMNKFDSRNFGFSVNYKIPTRNRLAKEAPNLLNQE